MTSVPSPSNNQPGIRQPVSRALVSRRHATRLLLAAALPVAAGCARESRSAPMAVPGSPAAGPSMPATGASEKAATGSRAAHGATGSPLSGLTTDRAAGAAVSVQDVARRSIPVVCYHQIRPWRADDTPAARSLTTPPGLFARQMALLRDQGWTSISPPDYYAALVDGGALPPKPVLLTFDDGHGTQWDSLPVLRRYGFTATFFPMTVVLDKPNWLRRDQLRELDDMGMTVGVHTYNHERVTRYAGRDWAEQLAAPKRQLERLLGHPVDWFAYPFGLWNRAALPHVADAGFKAAFQLVAEDLDPDHPLLTLRRFLVDTTSIAGFDRQLVAAAPRTQAR